MKPTARSARNPAARVADDEKPFAPNPDFVNAKFPLLFDVSNLRQTRYSACCEKLNADHAGESSNVQ